MAAFLGGSRRWSALVIRFLSWQLRWVAGGECGLSGDEIVLLQVNESLTEGVRQARASASRAGGAIVAARADVAIAASRSSRVRSPGSAALGRPGQMIDLWPNFGVACCVGWLMLRSSLVRLTYRAISFVDEDGTASSAQAWAAAAGTAPHALALCALFVSYHFYACLAKDGLFRVPGWVVFCMVLAVVGAELRACAIFSATYWRKRLLRKLPEIPEMMDTVCPMLPPNILDLIQKYTFTQPWMPDVIYAGHVVGESFVTVGTLGVLVGVIQVHVGSHVPLSLASAGLGSLFYVLCLGLLETARYREHAHNAPYNAECTSETQTRNSAISALRPDSFVRALTAASHVASKGPMLAVQCLLHWERQSVMHFSIGSPEMWGLGVSLVALAALILEATACAVVATRSEKPPDLFGVVHGASGFFVVCARIFAGVFYLGIALSYVEFCQHLPSWKQGAEAVIAALIVGIVFWGVYFVEWAGATVSLLTGYKRSHIIQRGLLAAGAMSASCPMLGMLFSVCWFRASCLTDGQGAPQSWALESMMICAIVVSTTALPQLIILVAVRFSGTAVADADGGSLVCSVVPRLAYIVTFAAAFNFCWLQIGTLTVWVSLFLLTPETALYVEPRWLGWVVFVCSLVPSILVSVGKLIGVAVKLSVDELNRRSGDSKRFPEVHIGSVAVSAITGYVTVRDLVWHNPSGQEDWRTPHMLRVHRLSVSVDIAQFLKSFGRSLHLEGIEINELQANIDAPKGLVTNLEVVLRNLPSHRGGLRNKRTPASCLAGCSGCVRCCAGSVRRFRDAAIAEANPSEKEDEDIEVSSLFVTIHRLPDLIQIDGIRIFCQLGPLPPLFYSLGDVEVHDFREELVGLMRSFGFLLNRRAAMYDRLESTRKIRELLLVLAAWLFETVLRTSLLRTSLLSASEYGPLSQQAASTVFAKLGFHGLTDQRG